MLGGVAPSAQAVTSVDTTRVEVPLAGRGAEQVSAAATVALASALTRATGSVVAAESPAIHRLQPDIARFVQATGLGGAPGAPTLVVTFDEGALRDLAGELDLQLWPRRRPDVVLWLAFDDGAERLLGAADPHPLAAALVAAATQRGLPLALPLLDLDDTTTVTAAMARARFRGPLLDASRRYGAELVVAGVVREDPLGAFVAELDVLPAADGALLSLLAATTGAPDAPVWREAVADGTGSPIAAATAAAAEAGGGGAVAATTTVAAAPRLLLAEADADGLAAALVDHLVGAVIRVLAANAAAPARAVPLVVHGIRDVDGYAGSLAALASVDFVERVDVRGLDAGSLQVDAWSRAPRATLLANVALRGGSLRLRPAAAATAAGVGVATATGTAAVADATAVLAGSELEWSRR
jgi:hypothetical protein